MISGRKQSILVCLPNRKVSSKWTSITLSSRVVPRGRLQCYAIDTQAHQLAPVEEEEAASQPPAVMRFIGQWVWASSYQSADDQVI